VQARYEHRLLQAGQRPVIGCTEHIRDEYKIRVIRLM
jgi:hypothetical protein